MFVQSGIYGGKPGVSFEIRYILLHFVILDFKKKKKNSVIERINHLTH